MSKKLSSKTKFKVGEIWYLQWIDSYAASENCWMSGDDMQELIDNPSLIEEVGFIVGVTSDFVALVGGQCRVEDEDGSIFANKYHRDVVIPLVAIVKSVNLTSKVYTPKK